MGMLAGALFCRGKSCKMSCMDRGWFRVLLVLALPNLVRMAPSNRIHDGEQVNSIGDTTLCHVKEFSFTATVADRNGKTCSGKVTTKACFGSCESSETGTFRFPWIVRVQPVCNYGEVVTRIVRLRHCESGADRDAGFYRFPEAKTCICETCDPKRQQCESHTSTPPTLEWTMEPYRTAKKESSLSISDYSNDAPFVPEAIFMSPLLPRRKWKKA